jgi:hypothetical protein
MSYKQRPEGEDGAPSRVVEALHRVAERARTHTAAWPARYVETRVEARDGD